MDLLEKQPLSDGEKEKLKQKRLTVNYAKSVAYARNQIAQFGLKSEKTIRTMRKKMDKIAYLHERYPTTKGDDAQLVYRYWTVFSNIRILVKRKCANCGELTWEEFHCGVESKPDFECILFLPNPDNITRINRFFKSAGFYLPSRNTFGRQQVLAKANRGYWVQRAYDDAAQLKRGDEF